MSVTKTSRKAYSDNGQFNGSNESILAIVAKLQPVTVTGVVRYLDATYPMPEFDGRRRERRIIGGMSTLKKEGIIRAAGLELNPETNNENELFEVNPGKPVPRLTKMEMAVAEIERLHEEMEELVEQNEFLIMRNERLVEEITALKGGK